MMNKQTAAQMTTLVGQATPALYRLLIRGLLMTAVIAIHSLALAKAEPPDTRWRDSGGQPRAAVALSFTHRQAAANNTEQHPPVPSQTTAAIAPEQKLATTAQTSQPPGAAPKPLAATRTSESETEAEVEVEVEIEESLANSAANLIENNSDTSGAHDQIEISEPVFASQPNPPRYPTIARKRGQEGVVWLDIWLNAQGHQVKLALLKSSGLQVLDSAALSAVKRWQFKPRVIDGIARASRVHIPVEFSLNNH
jgi:protein TonB